MKRTYELYDNGDLVGVYRSRDIAKKLGINQQYVCRSARWGKVIKKRYLVKVFETEDIDQEEKTEDDENEKWKQEWDEVRLLILQHRR